MKVKQHRMSCIFALDEHPLFHTVYVDKYFFWNAARQRTSILINERYRFSGTPQLQYAYKNEYTNQ